MVCLDAVCQVYSDCCGKQYGDQCVNAARNNPNTCIPWAANNKCNATSPVGGCTDSDCEKLVCKINPECCNSPLRTGEWSQACVDVAADVCPTETDPPLNSCLEASSRSGCTDSDCQAEVCLDLDRCCTTAYSVECVGIARKLPQVCDLEKAPCNKPSLAGGCNKAECEDQVCDSKPECCNTDAQLGEWSLACVDVAEQLCDRVNSCFEGVKKPGCNDPVCETYVCKTDDFCCRVQWDSSCVKKAMTNLEECSNDFPIQDNDCFHADPFDRPKCIGNDVCLESVCAIRPECCLESYSKECSDIALKACTLPVPENHCFQSSTVPGCDDEKCLEKVCEEDDKCCTVAYNGNCVGIARQNGLVCIPPNVGNICTKQSSPYGGCADYRCANSVCNFFAGCCNDGNEIGEWDRPCVSQAQDICQPEVIPRPPDAVECPVGYTCDVEIMTNCTDLAMTYIETWQFGDVYAGTYCGEDREGDGIMNCPRGYYCPTPEEKYICPAGFYCPYKTSNPDFICRQCKEGAQSVQRGLYGYITLGLFLVIIFIHCMIKVAERNNRGFAKLVQGLGLGLKITVRNSETFGNKKVDADLLAKIRPKLKLINRRLAELTEKQSRKNLSDSFTGSSKKQKKQETDDAHFDARRVFDLLDDDHSGDVDFDEINAILELNCFELSEFVRRMNELAGIKDKEKMKSVTRPVFVKYFLTVLKETANLTVTFEEAEAMFDEMANIGRTKVDKIHMSKFYVSSMSDFLSDIQILDLIKRFKQMKKDSAPSSDNRNSRVSRIGRQSLALSRGRSIRLSGGRRPSIGIQDQVNDASLMIVSKDVFTEHYPQFLMDITIEANAEVDEEALVSETPGVDIVFQDLSLNIKVGDGNISVVENVTGRLRGRTMTALMGGSGAGKTSLLNALCGRAFYGETTGTIHVNGHKTSIEEHKDAVGFVPQDDIVYAELTVRENLIFAGRFRLPKGTSDEEIKELADETLANLGLSRVADSPVGDVRRRGVSGGEKKRVNIGLELMARPSVLFLDEPTSGLDASSALLVMKSLKTLVDRQGVTVVSVIHQPRKFIFDLFDSLILLGVGGRMVYHGPTKTATEYFKSLNYSLPPGESIADWLIDISSGRLEADSKIADIAPKSELLKAFAKVSPTAYRNLSSSFDLDIVDENGDDKDIDDGKREATTPHDENGDDKDTDDDKGEATTLHAKQMMRGDMDSLEREKSLRIDELKSKDDEENSSFEDVQETKLVPGESQRIRVNDDHVCGSRGVTGGKVVQAFEEAKIRRAWLYEEWNKYFTTMIAAEKALYAVPEEYDLPKDVIKPSFFTQLNHQVKRGFIVARRNLFSKVIDAAIIVAAVIIITATDGVAEISLDHDPDIPFDIMTRPDIEEDGKILNTELFGYALTRQITYPLKVGIILCVLLGLTATKIVTQKRLEFFREAGSGYNINAYFVALVVISTLEHALQVIIAAFFSVWLRHPFASTGSYWVHFLLLMWICVGWALLIPMIVPPDSVVLVAGFFFAFCGLMFSGAFPPVLYEAIYEGGFLPVFAGWVAPTRFFYEALTVGEYRCLPVQSGFTIPDSAENRQWNTSMMVNLGYAGNDPPATLRSCSGWYWSVVPAILIGITVRYMAILAMHGFGRAQQTKKPLLHMMKKDKKTMLNVIVFIIILAGLLCLTTWTFLRKTPWELKEVGDNFRDSIFDNILG